MFDVAILKSLSRWAEDHTVPENVIDQARADGAYEGFRGIVEARHMPTHGWFQVDIEGESVLVTFRHRLPDGRIERRYAARFSSSSGWIPAP
jgi:hypothetical protein